MPVFQSANFLCTTTGLKNSAWPGTACYIHQISLCADAISGFPIWVRLVGTFWAKWQKTAWKLQNQHFLDKTEGGHGGKPIVWVVEGGSPQSSPTSGNPASYSWTQSDIFNCKYLVEKYFFWKISIW